MELELESHPLVWNHTANILRLWGWVGFWIQLVLTLVSGLILGFAILDPNLNLNLKSGIGLLSVIGGILALGLSIYWFFRYVKQGQRLQSSDPALHPSYKETTQVLQLGVLVNLVAMLLTLVGIETIVGALLFKTLSVPQGVAVYRIGQLIEPIDIFVIQANISMIVAQFVGICIPFCLASRVEHQ